MKNDQKAPRHLSKEAKRTWKEILCEYGIDDAAGLRILRVALEAHDRCQVARAAIDKDGMTVKDKFGQVKPHPLLATERDSRAAFLQAIKQLNLDIEPLKDRPGRPSGR